ncbi:hypothetical protein ACN469_04955 [Corallococcus terminator]
MRTVRPAGPILDVSEDPKKVISDFLGYALSFGKITGHSPAETLAERFSPQGKGMTVPDVFLAYRPEGPDDLPPEFTEAGSPDLKGKETWVLTRLNFGRLSVSELVDGPELRHLIQEALKLNSERAPS